MKTAWIFPLLLATTTLAGEVVIDKHVFRVPDGFTVEKVAGPPLVDRPIVADFDELGRLYVADSSGSNDAPQQQLANPSHRIVRLEDTDGDGKYDKSVVFADKMMFPEGAMWRDGSLYVAAPPSIWKLADTNGDGVCDKREEWFKGKTLTGCANDLHGPYNGPDGWIYWCKGAFAEQTYALPNGKPFKTRAAHIFRARPDGTNIEPVLTGGMDNPVEIAWSPGGEMFFTTTFLQHPGGGKRDGIIHGIYGGVYGKDHDVLDGHIRTGPDLMPVMTHLGPAAPSGLMRYESSAFGTAYKDNLFCAQFNMHKVSRHILEPVGASFKTTDSDFLSVADHHDFHPTDVLEDADGSILVLDTGGWYKLCCPTSQIGKPDVLGGIYRVKRMNAETFDDPRGAKIDWAKSTLGFQVDRLDDPRPFVRRRAIDAIATGGEEAAEFLWKAIDRERSAEMRRSATWALTRMKGKTARDLALAMLMDEDLTVRLAAWHAIDRSPLPLDESDRREIKSSLMTVSQHHRPLTARKAVEVAGRLRVREASGPLVAILAQYPGDTMIEHSVIRAMIDIDIPEQQVFTLSLKPQARGFAPMVALDQAGHRVPIDAILRALGGNDERSREVAEWIVERHPEYSDDVAVDLASRLAKNPISEGEFKVLGRQLARFSNSARVRGLLGNALRSNNTPRDLRLMAVRSIEKSGLRALPGEWRDGLMLALRSNDPEIATAAIAAARAMPSANDAAGELASTLIKVADRDDAPSALRLDALVALPGGAGTLSGPIFGFLRTQIGPDLPVSTRLAAAGVLARAKLSADQLTNLADALRVAGPLDAADLLAAFDHTTDDAIGRKLVAALKDSPALTSLRVETLKPRFAKFGQPVQDAAASLYDLIERGAADQRAKLDDLTKTIPEGDVRRGQAVFNGTKAACLSCHAIGYVGGTVGPDLSRIGAIRNDRDLLESIVFPSASFVRSYEPMVVATKEGQVHSGVLRKDSPEEVVLATGPDKEVRISRADVEEMKPGTVSVMPSGLDQQVTKQELADLLAFLKSRK
ncbi:MAG: putative rane-bound dehydrogenase [Planctomycetota bacterium]|nr:putative rane-bound dehydrogenase [Planctomycetota bacterium]